jgi:hypothetical protein
MVKFSKIVLTGVEAKRERPGRSKDMAISVSVDGLKRTASGLDASFTYLVRYSPEVGFLRLAGYVSLEGTKKELDDLHAEWKKNKQMDKERAQKIVNIITYVASVNGIFAAKTLNLEAPFMGPRVELEM